MYQLVPFSDPKSLDEWDKQLGVFAVRPKGRKVDERDPNTAVIQISADFSTERPLLALQEYIAYANLQVQQSKRWIDKSLEEREGQEYHFPWHTVTGDVKLEGVPPYPLKFELDRGRLLNLLVGHTIYNDPTVAIRELLQNGIDAVRYQHHLDTRNALASGKPVPPVGRVRVTWDEDSRVLSVEDSGVGMNKSVVEKHLMRVGASFYDTDDFKTEHADFSPISRFGIGILTCFMVSDDIAIVTCKNDSGLRIRMTSVHTDYLLRELPPGDPSLKGLEGHGTRVTLGLREDVDFRGRTVLDIVRFWIIIPGCDVEYAEPRKPLVVPIGWRSAEDALRSFMAGEDASLRRAAHREIIVKRHEERSDDRSSTARYELAFAVESRLFPERSFVERREGTPAVCIEGIRVADALPWFSQGPAALLAVSGDRKLGTTVSRSGLEQDEEYERAGKLCTTMLFEHAYDEIARIAAKPGHPLSEASSGGEFIMRYLLSTSAKTIASEALQSLVRQAQSIVIERQEDTISASRRCLISRYELNVLEEFWTIESRLVDSINFISHDLGRELAVSEFLASLSLETRFAGFFPLLAEAGQFVDEIYETHSAQRVEFNRARKETAIQWSRAAKAEAPREFSVNGIMTDELFRKGSSHDRYLLRRLVALPVVTLIDPIEDDPLVEIVASDAGLFIAEKSKAAGVWRALQLTVTHLAEFGDIEALIRVLTMIRALVDNITSLQGRQHDEEWPRGVSIVNETVDHLGSTMRVPYELDGLVDQERVFSARRYWRNPWERETHES